MQPLPHATKALLRRALHHSPERIRLLATRVPFSRFAGAASQLLWGTERVSWRGCNVEVNPGELHGYFLYLLGEYASSEIAKLTELCRDARVFADVGANVGLVSLALARAYPALQVFAFEPSPEIAERLKRHLALNPDLAPQIEFSQIAASDADGELHFEPSDHAHNPETGHLVASASSRAIAVRARRLDAFFGERGVVPDVMKIDVEGAELAVLRGISELLQRGQPRAMLIEVHGFSAGAHELAFKRDVDGVLRAAGYSVLRHHNDQWLPAGDPSTWPDRCHVICLHDGAA